MAYAAFAAWWKLVPPPFVPGQVHVFVRRVSPRGLTPRGKVLLLAWLANGSDRTVGDSDVMNPWHSCKPYNVLLTDAAGREVHPRPVTVVTRAGRPTVQPWVAFPPGAWVRSWFVVDLDAYDTKPGQPYWAEPRVYVAFSPWGKSPPPGIGPDCRVATDRVQVSP